MHQDKCFIIAELSANHGGRLDIAKETVRAAKRSGADAIKLQTYTADTITLDVKTDLFKISQDTIWDGKYLYDLYKDAFLPWEWHKPLFDLANELDMVCFSSPFDNSAVDFLEDLNSPIYKIASFEITDIPLIKYIASKQKPIIFSTGIANLDDIELAINACKSMENHDITILKCTSAYPADPKDANLLTIPDLIKRFNLKVGLSDHTLGIEAPVVAVSLGASVIEKHFILNKDINSADAHFSLDEQEFKAMVDAVRKAESLLGRVYYEMDEKKKKSREFSRSLFVSESVKKNETITHHNVKSVRPGFGMHPKHFESVFGKAFKRDIEKGEPLRFDMIEGL